MSKGNTHEFELQDLPVELTHEILLYLDVRDVLSISYTCKRYSQICMPHIYSDVELKFDGEAISKSRYWGRLFGEETAAAELASFHEYLANVNRIKPEELKKEELEVRRGLKLWHDLLLERKGRFLLKLTLDANGCNELSDLGVNIQEGVVGLFQTLNSERLTFLAIEYQWIQLMSAFANLQTLHVTTIFRDSPMDYGAATLRDSMVSGIRAPSLKTLDFKILGYHDLCAVPPAFAANAFFRLLVEVPTIKALSFLIPPQTHRTERDSGPRVANSLLELVKEVYLPTLAKLNICVPSTLLKRRFQYAFDGIQQLNGDDISDSASFYSLLTRFTNRHIDSILDFEWGCQVITQSNVDQFLDMEIIKLRPPRAASRLSIAPPKRLRSRRTDMPTLAWFESLKEDRDTDVTEFELLMGGTACQEVTYWLSDYFPYFHNLSKLVLSVLDCGGFAEMVPHSMNRLLVLMGLGSKSVTPLASVTPQGLQILEYDVNCLFYSQFKKYRFDLSRFFELFQSAPWLHSASFKFIDDWVVRQVILRRQPFELGEWPISRKKVCAWVTTTVHQKNGKGHKAIEGYREQILVGDAYYGVDADSWELSGEDVRRILRCDRNGREGCRQFLEPSDRY